MAEKKQFVKGFTPRVVCGPFPKVYEPDSYKGGKAAYKIKVIGSKDALADFLGKVQEVATQALSDARAELEAAFTAAKSGKEKGSIKEQLAKLEPADEPFKSMYDDDGNETDDIIVQFKSPSTYKDKKTGKELPMHPPVIVDRHGKPLDKPVLFGQGSEVIVAYEIRPFYTATVGAGASLRLTGVQLCKAVRGGSAVPQFGETDGEDIDYGLMGFQPQADSSEAQGSTAGDTEADAF